MSTLKGKQVGKFDTIKFNQQSSTPSLSSGESAIYIKSDGKAYKKVGANPEVELGAGSSGSGSNDFLTKNFVDSSIVPLPIGNSQINEFIDSFDGVTKWKNNLGVVYPAPDGQVLQPDNIEFAVKLSVVATSGQVVLSWMTRPEDIQYKIYYGTLGTSINLTGTPNFTDTPPTTSRTITGLTNGTQYEFYVVRITKPLAGRLVATPGASLSNFIIDTADGSAGTTGQVTASYNIQSGTVRYDLIYEQTSNAAFYNPQIVQGTTALSINRTGVSRYTTNINITSAVRSNNIVTVTTSTAHGLSLSTNKNINIFGANESSFNGEGFILIGVPSSTTFTYYCPGSNQTATGTLYCNQYLQYIWMVRAGSGDNSITPSSLVRASSVTTITTVSPHGLVAGRIIIITGANESSFNGNWVVLNVLSTTQFTIKNNGTNQTATGTISITTNTEISRTTIVSQEVCPKYFGKVYNPNTTGEFLAWSCKDPNNSYNGEPARSPNYYKNPTSYSDSLFTNTKYLSVVIDYIRIRVRPRSTFSPITVAGNFLGSQSRCYGSVFELTNGHKTADQMTFDSLTNVFNVGNDDMDSYAMENDGGAIVSNVNSADMSLAHFMKITRALGNSTTAISQNDQPTISALCRMAVFLAANNGSNRGIKVFVDLTNQRLAWINGGTTYNVAFSTLGITLGSTSATVYVIGDQINELHIGNRSTQVAYVCEFNWNTNTVVKRNATAMPSAEFRYGTEEDEFGELLYTVNGKNFYFKSIVTDSATLGATRTVRWTMVGDLDNPFNGTEVLHNVTFTPLNTNLTANNFTWGVQGGIDYMGIIESSSGTNRLYMMDWGHDSASLFTQNDNDQTMGMARTNIFYIANGNGVI